MKKLFILTFGLMFLAASCNKTVSVNDVPTQVVIKAPQQQPSGSGGQTLLEPKAEPKVDKPNDNKIVINDVLDIPTPEELAFQTDQNTIKNIEQDSKLTELDNRVGELEKTPTVTTPTPPPTPTTCKDTNATNNGGTLPCTYPPPPTPTPACESGQFGTVQVVVNGTIPSDFIYGIWRDEIWQEGPTGKGSQSVKAHVGNYQVKVDANAEYELSPSSGALGACETIIFTINF